MNILYIENNHELSLAVREKLKSHYNVDIANTCRDGILKIESKEYDLLIIGHYLANTNETKICEKIREMDIKVPILFFVNNQKKEIVIEALDAGADDCLIKPFSLDELEARIRALLRRNNNKTLGNLSVGKLLIKLDDQYVTYHNQIIKLPRQEYMLLKYLAVNRGKLVPREELYEHVWGVDGYYNSNTIDVHIRRLRKKLKLITNDEYIKSVYGYGYRI
ncbi:MAG: response regulator transcription factor [Candidatus Shapirobacteria bacterium]